MRGQAEAHTRAAERLAELTPILQAHPDREILRKSLAAVEAAEQRAGNLRTEARKLREARGGAAKEAAELREQAEQAWVRLDTAGDTVAALAPPTLPRDDLQHAWGILLGWRDQTAVSADSALRNLDRRVQDARRARDHERGALVTKLHHHELAVAADVTRPRSGSWSPRKSPAPRATWSGSGRTAPAPPH